MDLDKFFAKFDPSRTRPGRNQYTREEIRELARLLGVEQLNTNG